MDSRRSRRLKIGVWDYGTQRDKHYLPENFLLQKEMEVQIWGFWLKALVAIIIGRALWPGPSPGDNTEQSSQDYDRGYEDGYDHVYEDSHEEWFHEHDDPDFFNDDFFE